MLDFYEFVRERESVRLRRAAGRDRPWTEDPILSQYFFTNVFREDDPGTAVATEIMSADRPAWERLANLVLYRRVGSEESWRGWGGYRFMDEPGPLQEAAAQLRSRKAAGETIFGGAYFVPLVGGDKGLDGIAKLFGSVWNSRALLRRLAEGLADKSVRQAYASASTAGIWCVKEFLGWQLALDMRYGPDPIVTASDDEWAPAGLGAATGLTWLGTWPETPEVELPTDTGQMRAGRRTRGDVVVKAPGTRVLEERMAETRDRQPADLPRRMTMASVEHGMCEWSKYVRIAKGGRGRTYHPGTPTNKKES